MHDRFEDALCLQEIDPVSVVLYRMFEDMLGPLITYGKHLLQLGESTILSFLRFRWPYLFLHNGGASVVDNIHDPGQPKFASRHPTPYYLSLLPIAEHDLITFSLYGLPSPRPTRYFSFDAP
jgi:hypothetical protein